MINEKQIVLFGYSSSRGIATNVPHGYMMISVVKKHTIHKKSISVMRRLRLSPRRRIIYVNETYTQEAVPGIDVYLFLSNITIYYQILLGDDIK